MKVVVRSSSLLFTLLSIVLDVPIQRVKRSVEGNGSRPAKDSKLVTEASQTLIPKHEAMTVAAERSSGPR